MLLANNTTNLAKIKVIITLLNIITTEFAILPDLQGYLLLCNSPLIICPNRGNMFPVSLQYHRRSVLSFTASYS
ncbi:hypothetical protein M2408_003130 [Sphingobacterium sp. BIGb0165]|nr:hypothetical protein [Sphingobacterium sp. BIGb0165]